MGLEDKVEDKESKSLMQKAFNLGFKSLLAAGATMFSLATVGNLGVIVGGALAAGRFIGGVIKKQTLYEVIEKSLGSYTVINAILHPIIWLGDATIPLVPTFWGKALYAIGPYNAAFVAAFRAAEHLYEHNLNPSGIVNSIKENFYNGYKRIGLGFAPAYALVANGITHFAGIPIFAINAFPVGLYNAVSPPKKGEKGDPQLLNPFYLVKEGAVGGKKLLSEIYTAAHNIGSGIRDLYKKVPKPAPVPQPAPA